MKRSTAIAAAMCGVVYAVGSAHAGPMGYAQATGYYKQESRPTLYQPLNLLDGRDATAWCTPTADTLTDHLSFGLKADEKIEEFKISNGNNFSAETWAAFGRAKKIEIKAGSQTRTINLEDQRGMQTVTLDPPLDGSRFTVEVLDSYPPDDPDQPVCVTDFIFVSQGKALSGSYLTSKLKYDKSLFQVMGTWFGGYDDKPDHFLSFFFDGTFRYSYEPYDTQRYKPKNLEGEFDVSGGRIVFTIKGAKGKVAAKMQKDASRKGSKGGFTLAFEGEVPAELKQVFRSVP